MDADDSPPEEMVALDGSDLTIRSGVFTLAHMYDTLHLKTLAVEMFQTVAQVQ
jgi:hypothetical protein